MEAAHLTNPGGAGMIGRPATGQENDYMRRNFGDLQSRLDRMHGSSLSGMLGRSEQRKGGGMKVVHLFFGFLFANMFVCLVVLGLSALVGAFAWPYALNEWLVFAGRPASVEPWHGALIGLVPGFGQASLPAAVITWIAMLFLVG